MKQAEMVLAADPGVPGHAPRVWVYRNNIKALNWFSSVREKLGTRNWVFFIGCWAAHFAHSLRHRRSEVFELVRQVSKLLRLSLPRRRNRQALERLISRKATAVHSLGGLPFYMESCATGASVRLVR